MVGRIFWRKWVGVFLGLLVLPVAHAANDVTLTATSLAPEGEWKGRVAPLIITATNPGPNRAGQIVVRANTYQMRYPMDLAQGAQKKVQVWLPTELGNRPTVAFESANYRVQIEPDPIELGSSWGGNDTRLILGISDNETDIRAWRTDNVVSLGDGDAPPAPTERANLRALTQGVKPEDAPDSWLAYHGLDYVVLGDGADRLSNDAVKALQQAVVAGKTLVVPTGASAPILSDPRWLTWWPATAGEPVAREPQWAASFGLQPGPLTERPLTVTNGEEVLNGFAVVGKRGEGRIFMLGSNPFEPGNAQRFPQGEIIRKLNSVRETDRNMGFSSLDDVSGSNMEVKPPSFALLLGILLTYIFIVGPLNFFVLHRLNRRELIWTTSPLISLLFAGLLFAQIRMPATAGTASVLVGMATVDPLSQEVQVMGRQRLYFGQAQQGDWKLDGIETMWPVRSENPMAAFMNSQSDLPAELIDTGTLEAKGVTSNALQIRQFAFAQTLPWDPQSLVLERSQGKATLVNRTAFQLDRVQIWSGREYMTLTDLKPGERGELKVRKVEARTPTQPAGSFLALMTPDAKTFGVGGATSVKGEMSLAGRLVEVQK